MRKELADEIIACLPEGRTFFHYFKDRYALLLLSSFCKDGASLSEVRKSPLGRLLDKPAVKQVLAACGDGRLYREVMESACLEQAEPFLLTLSTWDGYGSWEQTSRRGVNLVLQLNFTNKHDHYYRRLAKPLRDAALNGRGHPVLRAGTRSFFRETLAWARIDLDFASGEALIEEVQTDWLRVAKRLRQNMAGRKRDLRFRYGLEGEPEAIVRYVDEVLAPYMAYWDEAMLTAALMFVRRELGIRTVYYHSYETGAAVKRIYSGPPRSVYTRLPLRFCFEETDQAPAFLSSDKHFRRVIRKVKEPRWYRLHG